MTLYHASNVEVKRPMLVASNRGGVPVLNEYVFATPRAFRRLAFMRSEAL